jgi:hypothetical protein
MTDTVTTTVEVDEELWRAMRADGITVGRDKNEQLEHVLRERYGNG